VMPFMRSARRSSLELLLEQPVHPLQTLFLAKLDSVIGALLSRLPMLAGCIAPALERAFSV